MAKSSPKLFLSHASADSEYVEEFMDLILIQACGLTESQIRNTSLRNTGVPTGDDLFADLKATAEKSPLTVAIISPTYLTRPTCLAEMGAGWVRGTLFPFLTPNMTRDPLVGPLKTMLIEAPSDEKASLLELHDTIVQRFDTKVKALVWTRAIDKWMAMERRADLLAPPPKDITVENVEALELKLTNSTERISELTLEIDTLKAQNKALSGLKDAKEVEEVTLPTDQIALFEHLCSDARKAVSEIDGGYAKNELLRQEVAGKGITLPSDRNDRDEYYVAQDKGLITIDDEDGTVSLNYNAYGIDAAIERLETLDRFLDTNNVSDEFRTWFQGKYKATLSLTAEKTWSAIIG